MIDKLFGYISAAVDTGHPFWLAFAGIVFSLFIVFCLVMFVGVMTMNPPEHEED